MNHKKMGRCKFDLDERLRDRFEIPVLRSLRTTSSRTTETAHIMLLRLVLVDFAQWLKARYRAELRRTKGIK